MPASGLRLKGLGFGVPQVRRPRDDPACSLGFFFRFPFWPGSSFQTSRVRVRFGSRAWGFDYLESFLFFFIFFYFFING